MAKDDPVAPAYPTCRRHLVMVRHARYRICILTASTMLIGPFFRSMSNYGSAGLFINPLSRIGMAIAGLEAEFLAGAEVRCF